MEKMMSNIGMGLLSVLKSDGISVESAAHRIDYSERDFRRLIEGKLMVSPMELEKISKAFGTTMNYLMSFKPDKHCLLPELEYNKEFSSEDNLYKIVDYLDDYIELKEQM